MRKPTIAENGPLLGWAIGQGFALVEDAHLTVGRLTHRYAGFAQDIARPLGLDLVEVLKYCKVRFLVSMRVS
jgi:hypothetical protein